MNMRHRLPLLTPPTPAQLAAMRAERDIQAAIIQALTVLGAHVSATSQYRPSRQALGLPDLYVLWPARRLTFWVEVKSGKGTLSPAQQAWHALAARAGAPVCVARAVADVLAYADTLPANPPPPEESA